MANKTVGIVSAKYYCIYHNTASTILTHCVLQLLLAVVSQCCYYCCWQGPESDQDDESELSIAELKVQRERQKKEVEVLRQVEAKEMEEIVQRKLKAEQDVGCTWGFGMKLY